MVSSKDDSASDGENSAGDVPESKKSCLFSEGEKVLAYHGPKIYEAKVQKAEVRKDEWRYFVHYLGWNKNWDEWVDAGRLMKHNEENVLKQKALDKKKGVNAKSGRSAQTKPKTSADTKVDKEEIKNTASKGKKRKADSGTEKDNVSAEKLIKIQIPSTLKKQLVDDWELITQQNKLVKLPRSPTVDDIFTKYLEYRSKMDGMMTDSVGEILNGLRCYFDKALRVMLLYKKERHQYDEAISDNVSPSSVYGAEHLLRLFGFCKKIWTPFFFQLMIALNFLKEVEKDKLSYQSRVNTCINVIVSIGRTHSERLPFSILKLSLNLDVVRVLKDRAKLRVMMLTGDYKSSAWRVANAVGVNEVYRSLKPEEIIEKMWIALIT